MRLASSSSTMRMRAFSVEIEAAVAALDDMLTVVLR